MANRSIDVGGPFFEDLKVGQVFEDAPSLTLTPGHAAFYQALFGDRLRLPLDAELSAAVTGRAQPPAHPLLVCNVAIGQTTGASQRVRGNLFYRGLVLRRPVFLGDTLRTRTEVVGLKQNRLKEGKPATGLAALRIDVSNQAGEPVLGFWRCPMLPLRDRHANTGHADRFDGIPVELDLDEVVEAAPSEWRIDAFSEGTPGLAPRFADVAPGSTYVVEGRDTVTSAPEFVRMTLNLAQTHTDAAVGAYDRRLVYGGHTISVAGAQVSRALPTILTIVAWRGCDHTGPVFEGDVLRTEVTVEDTHPLDPEGGLLDLRAVVHADRADGSEEVPVLDWRFLALAA